MRSSKLSLLNSRTTYNRGRCGALIQKQIKLELFAEIIFRGIIVNVVGLYTRYYFFRLVGKTKTIEYLKGGKSTKDEYNNVSQNFLNSIVGLIITCLISVSIAYLVFSNWSI